MVVICRKAFAAPADECACDSPERAELAFDLAHVVQ